VVVVPVQGNIEQALVYVVRRGVKEAQERKASALVLDMNTDGGRVDAAEKILEIVRRFPEKEHCFTFVNTKAFSAGAFIAAATRRIYMSPGAVVGAATPILATGQEMPEAVEEKMTSAIRGLLRSVAEENGHNPAVFDAMVDRDSGLTVEGKEIVPKGKILTLTAKEAVALHGTPPKPLLAAGIVTNLAELLQLEGLAGANVVRIEETGFERLARGIVALSPLLLAAGGLLVWMEFKTPGFGWPGIAGIACFALFFLGHYVAGLSGQEYAVLFAAGLALVIVEFFVLPGLVIPGVAGAGMMLFAVLMAMVDRYPVDPVLPSLPQLTLPVMNLVLAGLGLAAGGALLIRMLPESWLMKRMAPAVVAGAPAVAPSRVGDEGIAETNLRPAGKARFGGRLEDVVTEGDLIEAGARVRVTGVEGMRVVVARTEA
jgi:membrane-bound serine protease (ClpP class)